MHKLAQQPHELLLLGRFQVAHHAAVHGIRARSQLLQHRRTCGRERQPPLPPWQHLTQNPALGLQPRRDIGCARRVQRNQLRQRHLVDAGGVVQRPQDRVLNRRHMPPLNVMKLRHRNLLRPADQMPRLLVQRHGGWGVCRLVHGFTVSHNFRPSCSATQARSACTNLLITF